MIIEQSGFEALLNKTIYISPRSLLQSPTGTLASLSHLLRCSSIIARIGGDVAFHIRKLPIQIVKLSLLS